MHELSEDHLQCLDPAVSGRAGNAAPGARRSAIRPGVRVSFAWPPQVSRPAVDEFPRFLAIQVLTGLWMGWIYLPGFQGLFRAANPSGLAWHIRGITALAIAFVVVGARGGGRQKLWTARAPARPPRPWPPICLPMRRSRFLPKDRFAPVKTFFSVKDFGGWSQVNKEFFGNGGIWDRLFANTR